MTQEEQKDWTENVRWADDRKSLLDQFAKAAMQGELMNQSDENGYYTTTKEDLKILAHRCYDIATAMIQERERRMKG